MPETYLFRPIYWEPLQGYKFSRLERYIDLGIPDKKFESELYTSWRLSRKMKKILPELVERVREGVSRTIKELDRKVGDVLKVGILKDFADVERTREKKYKTLGEYLEQGTFQKRVEKGEISREEAIERLEKLLTLYALTPLEIVHSYECAYVHEYKCPIGLYEPMFEGLLAYFRDPDKDLSIDPQEAQLSFLRLLLLLPPVKKGKGYISKQDFKKAGKMLLTYPLVKHELSPIRIRGTWLEGSKFEFMGEEIRVPDKDTISWDEFFYSPLNILKMYLYPFNAIILQVSFGFFEEEVRPEISSLLSRILDIKLELPPEKPWRLI